MAPAWNSHIRLTWHNGTFHVRAVIAQMAYLVYSSFSYAQIAG